MFYNIHNLFSSKQNIFEFIFLSIIFCLIIFFSFSIFETFNASSFAYDSTININVANNLRLGNGFVYNFINSATILDTVTGNPIINFTSSAIIDSFPNLESNYGKPPIYFLILAGFFELVSADPSNWILFGAIVSIISSILFIFIYYFLCRKYFGIIIAIFSTLIIITGATFMHFLTTARMNPLLWALLLLPFYFLNSTTKHYILFGITSATVALIHPIGMMPIVSYSLYLLFKKEFKGFLITSGIWTVIISPFLIHQHFTYDNFGFGLSIPFSKQISSFFISGSEIIQTPQSQKVGTLFFELVPSPFELLEGIFTNPYVRIHNVELFLFFSFFIIFAFIPIKKIKVNKKFFLSLLLLFPILSLIIFYPTLSDYLSLSTIQDHIFQIILLFSIPMLLFFINYFFKNNLIKHKSRFFSFVPFFSAIFFIAIYYSLHGTIAINHFVIFPLLFLLLPFGIYGYKKLIESFFNQTPYKHFISISLIAIIIIPFSLFMVSDNISYFSIHSEKFKDKETFIIYDWINNNVKDDSVLSTTEIPSILFLRTGNPAVFTPTELTNLESLKIEEAISFINKYTIEYFIIESSNDSPVILDILYFEPVFTCGIDCSIYGRIISPDTSEWIFYNPTMDDSKSIVNGELSEYALPIYYVDGEASIEKKKSLWKQMRIDSRILEKSISHQITILNQQKLLKELEYESAKTDFGIEYSKNKFLKNIGTGTYNAKWGFGNDDFINQINHFFNLSSQQLYELEIDLINNKLYLLKLKSDYAKLLSTNPSKIDVQNISDQYVYESYKFEEFTNEVNEFKKSHFESLSTINLVLKLYENDLFFNLNSELLKANASISPKKYHDFLLKIQNYENLFDYSQIKNDELKSILKNYHQSNVNYIKSNFIPIESKIESKIMSLEIDAKSQESLKNYENALQIYDHIFELDSSHYEAAAGKLRMYKVLDENQFLEESYDPLYLILENKIENKLQNQEFTHDYDLKFKELMKSEIEILNKQSKFDKVLEVYDRWLRIYEFDEEIWYEKAKLLEKMNDIDKSINAYEFLFKLVSLEEQNKIQEKLDELKLLKDTKSNYDKSKITSEYPLTIYDSIKSLPIFSIQNDISKSYVKYLYIVILNFEIDHWKNLSDEKTLLIYDEIISLDYTNSDAWKEKARILEKLERYDESIQAYTILMTLSPAEDVADIHEKIKLLSKK